MMKKYRRIDVLGRFVLPISIRRKFNIKCHDPVEIFTFNDCIILKKATPSCALCGSCERETELTDFKGKKICKECLKDFKERKL
jgi:transcriptional pleiotropic regulator of transition state genes